jgi:putative DNA primase/helicase
VNSLKYWDQTCELLVPMRDAEGKLWNLQLISAKKAKDGKFPRKFLKGGRTTETYYKAGPEPKEIVAIGEGVADLPPEF